MRSPRIPFRVLDPSGISCQTGRTASAPNGKSRNSPTARNLSLRMYFSSDASKSYIFLFVFTMMYLNCSLFRQTRWKKKNKKKNQPHRPTTKPQTAGEEMFSSGVKTLNARPRSISASLGFQMVFRYPMLTNEALLLLLGGSGKGGGGVPLLF